MIQAQLWLPHRLVDYCLNHEHMQLTQLTIHSAGFCFNGNIRGDFNNSGGTIEKDYSLFS